MSEMYRALICILAVFRKISLICVAGLGALLGACGGGSDQDTGAIANISVPVRGTIIDGHVARATVFLDTNNNGTRDPWEPSAFTDNGGYFSYNPILQLDYCAADAVEEHRQYCLTMNTDLTEAVVRMDGGYDILTGEPFYGQMARRVTIAESSDVVDSSIVSPLTTLLVNVTDANDRADIIETLGLEEADLDLDYVNSTTVDPEVLGAALKVHKSVAILADKLEDNYDSLGDEVGTPNDASAYVYSRLADELNNTGLSLDQVLMSETSLANILDDAEEDIRELYTDKEFDLPADLGSESNFGEYARTIDVTMNLAPVVDVLLTNTTEGVNFARASGASKVLESVVIKALNEETTDASLNSAIEFIANEDNSELVLALRNGMSSPTASVNELVLSEFSGEEFESEDRIANIGKLPDDAQAFTQIGGLQLRVSDLDLGQAPNDLDDSEVELYFLGSGSATSGALVACAKHIEGASEDGTLGEGNTRGERLEGFWSLLDATGTTIQSYSLLFTLTFLGTTYQSIVKPSGSEIVDGQEYKTFRFDFGDDIRTWHSVDGLIESSDLPESAEDCEARLPSRIGI